MGNWTGWKAVAAALVIMALIGLRAFNSMISSGPRTIDSGSWTVPAQKAMWTEIKASRSAKLQFEITRTTPGNFHVYLLDAQSHLRLQAGVPIAPGGNLNMIFSREGAGTISGQDIALANGSYYLYTENTENAPFTVNYRLTETQ